ncbi:hypothetical protein K432DRAFT_306323 [Lepidopterella palustris CBS 459.81]|uniref:Uncharacterized protein n=1 Tax=Lepidopterella palustris CBS 459.81 TaxID=1314670 RepID=A0A8E2E3C9_9PEZI|nr:hypothetical protein K432DRAFT_306323 [Lepidopterella palustris CBS 459.81]
MHFRQRVKRVFTRSSSGSNGDNSLSNSTSRNSSNVYKPGEKMPPMKYRRPVAPEHKEKLESFSFAKAWRRKSTQSQYSPMGSRLPSRKNSTHTVGRKSLQGTRLSMQAQRATGGNVEQVKEGSGDDADVSNVGLSCQHTHESIKPGPTSSMERCSQSNKSGDSRPQTGCANGGVKADTPFTQEDLELALKRSHLDVPK